MSALLLPVLRIAKLRAWPKHPQGGAAGYQLAAVALRQRYTTDAHTAGYSAPSVLRRLDKAAAEQLPGGVRMVALFVDVDGAEHKADPAWRAAESSKIAAAFAALPGGFCYQTRGGYRLVWRLAAPVIIASADDAARWRLRYWRTLLALSRRFGLEGDPACADWTRLYRLPHATRDEGGQPEDLPTEGDPELRQPLDLEISAADLAADLAEARRLEAAHPATKDERGKTTTAAPWGAAVKALALEAGEGEPEGGASLPLEEARPVDGPAAEAPPRTSGPRPSSKASSGARAPRLTREDRERLWAEKALERMASDLAATTRGGRNNAARDAALVLGHYAPHLLDPSAIERALLAACERNGLVRDDGRDAALTTIRSAISDGMKTPKRPNVSDDRTRDPEAWREEFRRARSAKNPNNEGAPMPADQEHAHDQADDGPARADWRAELQQDRSGYRKNLANVALILGNDEAWAGCLAFDEFSGRILLLKCPPSHVGLKSETFPRRWGDADEGRVAVWFQRTWKIEATPELVSQAVVVVAHEHRFHPVRDYLEGLRWDGVPRLARWLSTYLGVRETDYSRAVGAFMLRAAVARIFKPGCKVDTMLVLQGEQGAFKSTAIKTLCGAAWFTDELSDFGSKDAAMQLRGAWFIEAAELSGMMRAELERVKAFFSRAVERYRATYGRHVEDQPRQCVFFGTTNADTYLKDETGNRRFWPVLCGVVGGIDLEAISHDRDQLWAEAVEDFRRGERWHLDKTQDAKALRQAQAAQEAVRERDAWESCILAYLDKQAPVFVTTADLLGNAILLDRGRWGVSEQRRVGAIMRGLGWQRRQRGTGAGKEWGYVSPYLDPHREGAPMPGGATGPASHTGASGDRDTASKGCGTDSTGSTDGGEDSPGAARGGDSDGGYHPSNPPTANDASSHAETIGAIGSIGAYSQKTESKQEPIGTDAPPQAPMAHERTPLAELIRTLLEAPYVSQTFQYAQAEAERRLDPRSPRRLPEGADRAALEAAYREARARSERDRGPTPTPPPASGVKPSAGAPQAPPDVAAGAEGGTDVLL